MSLHKFYDDNVQALGSLQTMSTSQHSSVGLWEVAEVVLAGQMEVRIYQFYLLNHHRLRVDLLHLYLSLEDLIF